MSFWESEVGQITGKSADAFAKSFKIIPDDTQALAQIESFVLVDATRDKPACYEITWKIKDGEFIGRNVFQKIQAFDGDPKKKHRALNMLMYIFNLYKITPPTSTPLNGDLMQFVNKIAGIKIKEWSMVRGDGTLAEGNYISEVHPAADFKTVTGVKIEVSKSPVDSAFSRQAAVSSSVSDDDIPFLMRQE